MPRPLATLPFAACCGDGRFSHLASAASRSSSSSPRLSSRYLRRNSSGSALAAAGRVNTGGTDRRRPRALAEGLEVGKFVLDRRVREPFPGRVVIGGRKA